MTAVLTSRSMAHTAQRGLALLATRLHMGDVTQMR